MAMKRYLPDLVFFFCLLLTLAIYYPGAHGYFQFDDTINILESTRIRIQSLDIQSLATAANSGKAGFLQRPISVISFALNYYFTGLDPFFFKLSNIAIHLLNGVGIYYLSHLLLQANNANGHTKLDNNNSLWIALAVAAAWLLHPLNLTGVLYVVQRMTSLAAFFMILGMISYVIGRSRQQNHLAGWVWILSSFAVFTPLAMLCKENGALLPPLILLIELAFFRFRWVEMQGGRKLITLFSITVILPFITIVIFTVIHPEWISAAYRTREFTLVERCLTETRVIWFYIRLLVAPDISQFGLYHDDIAISHGLFDPISTIFSVAALGLLGMTALLSLKRHPIAAFGILFFLLGHSMESSLIALELVHEHRNYLPDFGLLFAIFYYVLYPFEHVQSLKLRRSFAIFFILMFGALTFSRSIQWSDPVQMKLKEVERHPNSVRANVEIGQLYAHIPASSKEEAEEFYDIAYNHLATAAVISPTDTLGLFGLIELNLKNSLPIEETWISALTTRLRKAPFAASTGNSLQRLNNCYVERSCAAKPEMIKAFIQAAMENKTAKSSRNAQLLIIWSLFLFGAEQRSEEAVKFAHMAAEVNPKDLETQIKVITLLININEPSEALKRILIVRGLDTVNIYKHVLDNLKINAIKNTRH
jgi:hypothetical protein